MILAVTCKECKEEIARIEGNSVKEISQLGSSLIIACHASLSHCSHSLKFNLIEVDLNDKEYKPIKIECLHRSCVGKEVGIFESEVPVELVSAITIVFHSSHEGHRLRIEWDGRTWESPAPK